MNEQPAIVQETWQVLRENAEQLRLLREQTREAFRDIEERFKETDAKFKETDAKFKETDAKFKETDASLKQATANVDALTGKWGKFVEGLIVPAADRLFQKYGMLVHEVSQRLKRRVNGQTMEIDILVSNDTDVVLIEVKSTLGVDDVNEHLERLARFKSFFPMYSEKQVFGAVAGIEITGSADQYAYRKGLFVIVQSGDNVCIANDDLFKPKAW